MKRRGVVIVGGGVSGLTVARSLVRAKRDVALFEASDRLGGNVRTESHDGFLYDTGADSFLKAKPHALRLSEELGMKGEWLEPLPGSAQVSVVHDGTLQPMPEGLALGVPTRPTALFESNLLSGLGKARAFLEPFVPRRLGGAEESILEFTSRRVGREMAERIVAPLLSGVSAGDANELGIEACFPQLVRLEREHGSLLSGTLGGKPFWHAFFASAARRGSPFVSLRRGLGSWIERLVAEIPPEAIERRARVERVVARPGGGALVTIGGETIEAERVVIAGAPWQAARLLEGVHDELAALLGEVHGAPTATIFFGLEAARVGHDLKGSGFIVPPGEAAILAGTFVSSKWSGRAPPGAALVRAFVGGARGAASGVVSRSDEELIALARGELERLLGGLGPLRFARVFRYERGNPQLTRGHEGRMRRARELLRRDLPWLRLTGAGYGGIGLSDCVRGGEEVGAELLST